MTAARASPTAKSAPRRAGPSPIGPALAASALILPLLAARVAAGPGDPVSGHDDVRASLLVLPLRGLLLLLALSLPALAGRPYARQRTADHVFLFLGVLVLLGLSGALLAGLAIDGSGNLGLATAAPAALAVLAVHTLALARYYRWPVQHAAAAGLVFSLLAVASWYTFATVDSFARLGTMDLLEHVTPVLLLLLVSALAVQTYKLHWRYHQAVGEGEVVGEGPTAEGAPATGVGTYTELLVVNLGLAAVLLCSVWST